MTRLPALRHSCPWSEAISYFIQELKTTHSQLPFELALWTQALPWWTCQLANKHLPTLWSRAINQFNAFHRKQLKIDPSSWRPERQLQVSMGLIALTDLDLVSTEKKSHPYFSIDQKKRLDKVHRNLSKKFHTDSLDLVLDPQGSKAQFHVLWNCAQGLHQQEDLQGLEQIQSSIEYFESNHAFAAPSEQLDVFAAGSRLASLQSTLDTALYLRDSHQCFPIFQALSSNPEWTPELHQLLTEELELLLRRFEPMNSNLKPRKTSAAHAPTPEASQVSLF